MPSKIRKTAALDNRVYGAVAGSGQRGVLRCDLRDAFSDASGNQVDQAVWRLEAAGRVRQVPMNRIAAEVRAIEWTPKQYIVLVQD